MKKTYDMLVCDSCGGTGSVTPWGDNQWEDLCYICRNSVEHEYLIVPGTELANKILRQLASQPHYYIEYDSKTSAISVTRISYMAPLSVENILSALGLM
jgi:hypothetical protein